MLRLIGYGRVSTDEQHIYGTGLETQQIECAAYAERIGAVLVGHEQDAGVSGTIYPRAGLERALERILRKEADGLLVHRVDRIGRKMYIPPTVYERLAQVGARLITVQDGEVNEANVMLFCIRCGMAQSDHQQLVANMRAGKRRLAEKGLTPTRGTPPYGYHIVLKIENGIVQEDAGKYQIIEDQAVIVRQIFALYASGLSLNGVATLLSAQGTPAPRKGRYRDDSKWHPASMVRMLENPAYKGEVVWGKYEHKKFAGTRKKTLLPEHLHVHIAVPPIVAPDIWQRCQERLVENKLNTERKDRQHLFKGLMFCPSCGRRLLVRAGSVQHNGPHVYYSCIKRGAKAMASGSPCAGTTHREDRIHASLLQYLSAIAHDPAFASAAYAAYVKDQQGEGHTDDIAALTQKLKELGAREEATIGGQIRAITTGARVEVYDRLLKEISEERARIEARIAEAAVTRDPRVWMTPADMGTVAAQTAADIIEMLENPDVTPLEKNEVLRTMVQSILPESGGYKITLRPFSQSDSVVLVTAMQIAATSITFSARFEGV
jgi:site-specific DNA recombinase